MSQSEPASSAMQTAPSDLNGARTYELGKGRHTFKWLDYEAPSPEALDALQKQYDFHPLAMEDVRTFDERAKVLDFGNYLFITVHALRNATDLQKAAVPDELDQDIHDQELE